MTPDSPLADNFLQARHLTIAARHEVQFVVLHTMENDPASQGALSVGRWWSSSTSPQTSAHYGVDTLGIVQYVREHDIAWACGHHGNYNGISIEICGRASMGEVDWQQYPSTIENASRLVADICSRWGLPVVLLDETALVRGDRGVTTHKAVSKAWAESDHVDPGDWLAGEIVTRAALL